MKIVILTLALLIWNTAAFADTPVLLTRVGGIPWDNHYPISTTFNGVSVKMSTENGVDGTLFVDYSDKAPAEIELTALYPSKGYGWPLQTLYGTPIASVSSNAKMAFKAPPPFEIREAPATGTLSMPCLVILGQVKYENVSPGSYLELTGFRGASGYHAHALGENKSFRESSDWRTVAIPFDTTGLKSNVNRLEIWLHLTGPGKVWFRNFALFQTRTPIGDAPAPLQEAAKDIQTNAAPLLPPHNSATSSRPASEPQLMTYLLWWPGAVNSRNAPPSTMLYTAPEPGESWVSIVHTTTTPIDFYRIDGAMLGIHSFANILPRPRRYGLLGTIIYENVTPESYLELANDFTMDNPISPVDKWKHYNIKAFFSGSSTGREFSLPFDSSKIKGELSGLSLNIHLAGEARLTLKDVRLVRYLDPLPESVTPSPSESPIVGSLAAEEPTQALRVEASVKHHPLSAYPGLKLIWFCLGTVFTLSILLVLAGGAFLFRTLRKRNNDREMRRIASLDS